MTSIARTLQLVFLAPLLIAGCFGSAPPVPRDHFYRLVLPVPASNGIGRQLPGVLSVEPLQADGLLHERPLLYSESRRALEVQQHDYHYWTEAPPRMLQDQLVAYLRHSGLSRSVVTPEMRVPADYRLSGTAKRLERLIGGDGLPRVVVALELTLVRLSDNSLIISDRFSEEGTATDGSVEASIVALNHATARILDRFVAKAAGSDTSMAENRPLRPSDTVGR